MYFDLEDGRGRIDWDKALAGQVNEIGNVSLSSEVDRSGYTLLDPSPLAPLTETQSLVATMLGAGQDLGEIANRLRVTKGTVERHIRVLKRYWRVSSISALVSRLTRAQLMYERSRALYLFDEVLPALVGARIEAPFLHEGEWCGLSVRLPSGKIKRLWLMSDESEEQSGWLRID